MDAGSSETSREELRKDVAVMRELGVLVWYNITLGPLPQKEAVDVEPKDPKASRREYFENLLNTRFTDEQLERLP